MVNENVTIVYVCWGLRHQGSLEQPAETFASGLGVSCNIFAVHICIRIANAEGCIEHNNIDSELKLAITDLQISVFFRGTSPSEISMFEYHSTSSIQLACNAIVGKIKLAAIPRDRFARLRP